MNTKNTITQLKSMSRRAKLVATGIGLLAIVLVVWWLAPGPYGTAENRIAVPIVEQAGEGTGEAVDLVTLTAEEIEEFGIDVQTAGPGTMSVEKNLPGEIRANEDRYAHVTPRVSGVVRSVSANVGSYVQAGQTMAVIESRELADLRRTISRQSNVRNWPARHSSGKNDCIIRKSPPRPTSWKPDKRTPKRVSGRGPRVKNSLHWVFLMTTSKRCLAKKNAAWWPTPLPLPFREA